MKRMILLSVLVATALFLSACLDVDRDEKASIKEERIPEVPAYTGSSLNMALVGKRPVVREKQIHFDEVTLQDLYDSPPAKYDAALIMPEHLTEAAEGKYVRMYKEMKIPYLFVESKAGHTPFLDMEAPVSYEEQAERVNNEDDYISGILYEGEKEGYGGWGFTYPVENNEFQRDRVKEIYSSVFQTIEEVMKENNSGTLE